ncbi:thiol:disulfide interchange protein DsbA/DsbL [Pseudomonas sp. ZM23]|uniref:Thiol:disulfide interchange protein n=1 Tax=Pseudomonas triclosanedens TaxID=2961893 RepID=A0ABY6ZZW2_9PSED|nr:thiol:disulfide interchange protein DsbA/DsbL [Pseudomonas triclosanedens]MCP8462684.1 thiol:disulfide interchange protein DsbA/DsbL [Pseudomonas triclosanedens]MCP8468303.1 thiol:disulfide interchange protein DsbA/DsbL [Pseudomonas triclosanedens]MCP8475062.1 thiol:disulfide interchange protein DsbA/DsbL [Pseudomonas triclosanedens]WAI49871.1 thiol:disulfide interchange protein DsbA/DsbL [Pseudomonas triclosanedens]
MRNLIFTAVLAFAGLFALSANATEFEAGKNYTELSPSVPVSQPGKIEVVELFWYGCPHCYAFEPTINPWVEKLPADVHFVRIPAMFGGLWNIHGQLFLTLESMGVESKVHHAIFEKLHNTPKSLTTPEEMAEFVAEQGVDKDKFLSTYNSFAIKGQIEKAKKLAMAYQISGVPTMVVNGKYRFDIGSAGNPDAALELADQLIAKERAAAKAAQ